MLILLRRLLMVGALCAVAVVPVPASGDAGAGHELAWQSYKVRHGIAVERRSVAGSRFYEYRSRVASPLPPETVIETLWRSVTEAATPIVKKRQVIKQEPFEVVFYDQIKTPVVSDRDYTLMVRKVAQPTVHRYQMTYETANHLGPPVDPKHVRIPAIRGAWIIEPNADGGSFLTYQSYSEPGGSIPPFLIHGAQLDQLVADIERALERLRRVAAKT